MVKSNDNTSYKRGQELLDQGMYKEAISQFDVAISEQPDSWKALNSKGFAFQKLSKYTEAVECFDKALAINPTSVEVLNIFDRFSIRIKSYLLLVFLHLGK